MIQTCEQNLRTKSNSHQSVSLSPSLWVRLCCLRGDYWPKGQSMSQADESNMFNVTFPHVYLEWTTQRARSLHSELRLTRETDKDRYSLWCLAQRCPMSQNPVFSKRDFKMSRLGPKPKNIQSNFTLHRRKQNIRHIRCWQWRFLS